MHCTGVRSLFVKCWATHHAYVLKVSLWRNVFVWRRNKGFVQWPPRTVVRDRSNCPNVTFHHRRIGF